MIYYGKIICMLRFIDTGENNGPMNMAIDEALLTAEFKYGFPPAIRVYKFVPPTLSVGYFQSAKKEIDFDALKKMGFGFVRRPTGGRAVLHDKELTYSITIAYPNRILEMNLLDSYHFLSSGIIKAIEYLGLKAYFSRNEDKNFSTPSCFSLPHFSDIVINDKKVVGSAQMRNKFGLLQHGSILYDVSIEDIFNCFRMDEEERKQSIEEGYSKITSLSKELGKKVDFYIIKQALKVGFREVFNEEIIETQITPFELEIAYNLYENKYNSLEWNFRK